MEITQNAPPLACLVILSVFLLQVKTTPVYENITANDPCTKLMFNSNHHGCQLCSLCKAEIPANNFHPACKDKNPNGINHDESMRLWCDDPSGPFPECPSINQSAILGICTSACKANGRKFAPGCICNVGCSRESSFAVLCTQNLHWNNSNIPRSCSDLIVSMSSTESIALESSIQRSDDGTLLPIPVIVIIVLSAVVTGVVAVVFIYKRQTGTDSSSDTSSNIPSEVIFPLIEYCTQVSEQQTKCTSLNKDASPVFEKITKLRNETQFSTSLPSTASKDSLRALQALLNSRSDLIEFTKMFDQEHEYGKVSWHIVAERLVGWDKEKVKSKDYLTRPVHTVGDGPMYNVMQEALETGKGLQELISCLSSLDHKNPQSIKFLEDFQRRWKMKNSDPDQKS